MCSPLTMMCLCTPLPMVQRVLPLGPTKPKMRFSPTSWYAEADATVTKKVEKPSTLALSSDAYIEIQNKRIEGTATTVLKYIQDNILTSSRLCPALSWTPIVETNPYAAASDGKAVAPALQERLSQALYREPAALYAVPPSRLRVWSCGALRGSYRWRYDLLPDESCSSRWACKTKLRRRGRCRPL